MPIHLKTTPTTQFLVILLIAPDNTSKDAEVAMPPSTNDCERQVVSPEPQGQVHFHLDLATESGAKRFEDVADTLNRCAESSFLRSFFHFSDPK